MSRKARILLIPNVAWWIIGKMGKEIVARFGDKYDFYFVPEGLFERRPELLDAFLPYMDAVHCLNESSIELFRDRHVKDLPPIVTWIHHVTTWSAQHQLAAEISQTLTVCTEDWKQYVSSRISPEIPITVVPHGVDTEVFRKVDVEPTRFGIPADRFVIGFIGSRGSDLDQGRKGTDTLLEVVKSVAGQLPNLHLLLGGPGWEGELDGLRSAGISVSATGYVRSVDLPALYSVLDVYLMTSRVEGGPCTVFESMACETPVVATRVGAVPDLISDGFNGYSAQVDDVCSLANAIVTLGRSPQRRPEMGRRCRDRVSQLPWGTVLLPLESIYDDLTRARRGGMGPIPSWMAKPEKVLRTTAAADALANVQNRFHKQQIGPIQGVRLLSEMLERKSLIDVVGGLALLRGLSFKAKPRLGA